MPFRPVLPAYSPPPLRAWGTTWRVLVALSTGALTFGGTLLSFPDGSDVLFALDLLLGLAAVVLMLWRRRRPLTIALVVSAISAVSASSAGALSIIVVSVSARRRWREVLAIGVVWIGAGYAYEQIVSTEVQVSWWAALLASALVYAVCVAVGFYIGGRRETLQNLEERAVRAEREQAARVDQARTAERSRIAREMHDVLAHRISLVAMHSGALAYRDDLTREETRATATIVRDNAYLALAELREVLGVLRDVASGATEPDRPQPTLGALPDLVEESRAAGTAVTCTVLAQTAEALASLPETTSRNAFRILQEALTNARKHAAGAPVELGLSGVPGGRLDIVLRNPVPEPAALASTGPDLPASGMGLAGLTERAKLAGGELTHGIDQGGQFAVRAWLPWP
ncbi:sensor histidine kinase [Sanguibacter antarcticus]|uniref:histidine kinase n=1 Tax=Sanguibacter antarcticus TaxID=372484 RepID=A0A2A9E8I2_9MICO|nr:histidine kinase [Sanguibacter antarcticus]PFG34871.1 signal transduction histidine kinase [Sanguibacter antarcticus]